MDKDSIIQKILDDRENYTTYKDTLNIVDEIFEDIEQLQALTKELAAGIVSRWYKGEYNLCIHCGDWSTGEEPTPIPEVVTKAQQYQDSLKESV